MLVTTNTTSKTVHDIVRNNGGDFIYTKNTLNYNPHALISILQSVDDYLEAAPPKEDLRWVSRTELRKAIAKLLAEISFMPVVCELHHRRDPVDRRVARNKSSRDGSGKRRLPAFDEQIHQLRRKH